MIAKHVKNLRKKRSKVSILSAIGEERSKRLGKRLGKFGIKRTIWIVAIKWETVDGKGGKGNVVNIFYP